MLPFLNKPLRMCSGLRLCPSAAVRPSPAPASLVRARVAAVRRVGSLGGAGKAAVFTVSQCSVGLVDGASRCLFTL